MGQWNLGQFPVTVELHSMVEEKKEKKHAFCSSFATFGSFERLPDTALCLSRHLGTGRNGQTHNGTEERSASFQSPLRRVPYPTPLAPISVKTDNCKPRKPKRDLIRVSDNKGTSRAINSIMYLH
jgi:hypothetical protein